MFDSDFASDVLFVASVVSSAEMCTRIDVSRLESFDSFSQFWMNLVITRSISQNLSCRLQSISRDTRGHTLLLEVSPMSKHSPSYFVQ